MTLNAITLAAGLTDVDLIRRTSELADQERAGTAELVVHLAELDSRKLYLEQGYGSLFSYCTGALRLSEHATFNRIEAARAGRSFPIIFELLAEGAVNLSTVRLLGPHLTAGNHAELLMEASGRSKREVETMVARLAPRPDVATSIRRVPMPLALPSRVDESRLASLHGEVRPSAAIAPSPFPRPVIAPLTPERYSVRFTMSRDSQEKLRRVQELLRREIPDGDPAAIFDRALGLLLDQLLRKKLAETSSPRRGRGVAGHSRHVPAAVRREVWLRDHGQCAFVSTTGRRCRQRAFLEFHHVEAYALGGATTAESLSLRCREHNVYEAALVFGPRDPTVREATVPYGTWCGGPT